MAPCSSKGLKVKTKEVKIPHLTNANKKKMEVWDLGGLFAVELNQTYEDLVEELAGHPDQKVAVPKYEYRGKPEAWTSDIWREVYNLPKASPGGYVMKGKIQFTELQLLGLVKGDQRQSKSRIFLEQVEGDSYFVLFCQMLNAVLAPIKVLRVYNKATYLGPYLVHLYSHFHEMDNEEKEDSKKRKALIQTVADSDTETEDEKEPKEEISQTAWERESSRSSRLIRRRRWITPIGEFIFRTLDRKPQNFSRRFTWRVHLYNHFHEMDNEEKEDSKKQKALIQTVSDSDTETEDEKEPKEEISQTAWERESSRSKPLDKKTTVDDGEF
ncbi:hypothetical protein R1flu_008388 [Riccia fluitans]|uniref:Uncharacterized protein n=1 Tax=Riccia fluitans TaxID=41844 RepID=A0ABD1YBK1_9MARC